MGRFQRAIGLVILGVAVLGALLLWVAVSSGERAPTQAPHRGFVFGVWEVLYDTEAPSTQILLAASGLALLFAAGVALLERRITTRSRRSEDLHRLPLAPKIVMAETRGIFHGPVTVTVLVPAHNEAGCIAETLASLLSQSHRPERVVVVADNCSDATEDIALALGVEVFRSVGNTRKKAGALNQALSELLPTQGENELVMVMDADTTLDDGFLEAAVRRMTDDRALMAIGGLFYGEQGKGLLGQFQRNEYVRYAREIKRRRGRVFVLTGTASLFRPRALRTVAEQRGHGLPGVPGDVYDTIALTEDNELTLALKSLGALMISPPECTVVTEVMPTWKALWVQRLRWQRGALENLGEYGLTPQTLRYWAQQIAIGYGVLALFSYFALILLMILAMDTWVWFPFWLGIGVLFAIERTITAWKGGWRARLVAVLIFPELVYDCFLNLAFLRGVFEIAFGRRATWKHVDHGGASAGATKEASS